MNNVPLPHPLPGTTARQFLRAAHALAAALVWPAGFAREVWLPFLTGAVILAVPFAVFGTEHFTAAKFVPAHLFWGYLSGGVSLLPACA
jgi:hypothetical protein